MWKAHGSGFSADSDLIISGCWTASLFAVTLEYKGQASVYTAVVYFENRSSLCNGLLLMIFFQGNKTVVQIVGTIPWVTMCFTSGPSAVVWREGNWRCRVSHHLCLCLECSGVIKKNLLLSFTYKMEN